MALRRYGHAPTWAVPGQAILSSFATVKYLASNCPQQEKIVENSKSIREQEKTNSE